MFPRKTEQAHAALQSHAGPLSLRERRVVILCDGKRSLDELSALFGPDTQALVVRLCEQGFLRIGPESAPDARAPVARLVPAPAHAPAPVPASAPAAPSTRRSLVAAKMYMIGMLELQRSEEALARRTHLQACREADAIVAHLIAALNYFQQHANASMAGRVRERLGEVLPEEYLPALGKAAA
ncbi:MAG: hypothetical protein QM761_00660 [Pseudoxanthomonas sp.]